MTAKEYLSKIYKYRRTLQKIEEKLEALYAEASGVKAITYDKDAVQVSPENHLEAMMIQVSEEADHWVSMKAVYERELRARIRMIDGLDRADYSEILQLRYLSNEDGVMRLEEIALKMNLSYERVRHLHGEALEAFRKKYLLQ